MRVVLGLLVDGMSYGALLFLISVGLSVTLGLMRFINLAHGAFAMLGGYMSLTLVRAWGMDFLLTLPLVFLGMAALGAATERLLLSRVYGASALEQVLFSIGLAFIAIAGATMAFGPQLQPIRVPAYLTERMWLGPVEVTRFRVMLIVLGFVAAAGLQYLFGHTLFGARVRAAVDNRRAAEGLGIRVPALFAVTFALGSGLAGVGGALASEVVGLDPAFPLKYVVYFLMVVAMGGIGSIGGSLAAGLLLGVADVGTKYYFPGAGAFVIYSVLVATLLVFPAGLRGRATL